MTAETAADVETQVTADVDALRAVETAARAARGAAADLADVPGERLDDALRAIADELDRQAKPVLAANEADVAAARADGITGALLDRLRLDDGAARGHRRPAPRAGPGPGRTVAADGQGTARRPAARRTPQAGGGNRG